MEEYKFSDHISLDWLSFSWRSIFNEEATKAKLVDPSLTEIILFFRTFPELNLGDRLIDINMYSHYQKCYQLFDGMLIYYDTEFGQNKGVMVSVPSHGLTSFYKLFGHTNVLDVLQDIHDRGGKFSRTDLCFDDFSKRFTPEDYIRFWTTDKFNTRFRCYGYTAGHNSGSTFYLGNRSGLKYMRIYDKSAESNGEIDSIRYEFELHSYCADSFINQVLNGEKFTFIDIIKQFFTIINRDNSNISRCSLDEDWKEWLDNLKFNEELFEFNIVLPPKSYEKSYNWFTKYCQSTFAKIYLTQGDPWLDHWIDQALHALKNKDKRIVEDVLNYFERKRKEV